MTKRLLSREEIDNLLSDIKINRSLPKTTALSIVNRIKENLREQLQGQMIYPAALPELKTEIMNYYHSSIVQPGESVGILTAQSIGERQTQMTLNTFHSAGLAIATVITGVPRFGELLNATRDPKMVSCQIYLKEHDDDLQQLRKYIGSSLREFTLKILTTDIIKHPTPITEPWFRTYLEFYNKYDIDDLMDHTHYAHVQFKLNMTHIFEYCLSIIDIVDAIVNEYNDIICIPSPIDKAQIDIFVDITNITLSEADLFIEEKNRAMIYVNNVVIPLLEDLSVAGISGIKNFYYKKYHEHGKSGWMIETQGSNFTELLTHPKIKTNILVSNNMWDIYNSLGIEAAREFLIDEFKNVVSSDGTYINMCHIMLLVDLMTFSGNISSISRYGVKRDQAGPLAKASFEESLDNFLKAGVFGDVETTKGISASIMLGKRSNIGTGLCDLVYDLNTLKSAPDIVGDVTENLFTDNLELPTVVREENPTEDDSEDDIISQSSFADLSDEEQSDHESLDDDDDEQLPDDQKSEIDEVKSSISDDDDSDCSNESDDLIFNDDEMDSFMNGQFED